MSRVARAIPSGINILGTPARRKSGVRKAGIRVCEGHARHWEGVPNPTVNSQPDDERAVCFQRIGVSNTLTLGKLFFFLSFQKETDSADPEAEKVHKEGAIK